MSLFGVDIAGIMAGAMGSKLLAVTLTRKVPTTRESGNLVDGFQQSTPLTYTCRGVFESGGTRNLGANPSAPISYAPASTLTESGDSKILILAGTFSTAGIVPATGDTLTIEGGTYSIVSVDVDPAVATFSCSVRGV